MHTCTWLRPQALSAPDMICERLTTASALHAEFLQVNAHTHIGLLTEATLCEDCYLLPECRENLSVLHTCGMHVSRDHLLPPSESFRS